MAERRMVSKVISLSEKVNSLSLFGRLLYTWMIPHADDFGRLPGSPAKVRVLVVPFCDETIRDVENELADMNRIGIIRWYEVDGERFIQIVNFENHQQGLHKRTKSKFPEPPEGKPPETPPKQEASEPSEDHNSESFQNIPGNSREFPLNRTELNRTEQKGTEGNKEAATHAYTHEEDQEPTISSVHTKVFGTLMMNGLVSDFVQKLKERGCSDEFIMEIILETGETATSPNLKYMKSTAERWIAEGIASREDARSRRGTGPPKNFEVSRTSAVPTAEQSRTRIDEIKEARRRKQEFLAKRAAEGISHGT